jgi:hypothetical protein
MRIINRAATTQIGRAGASNLETGPRLQGFSLEILALRAGKTNADITDITVSIFGSGWPTVAGGRGSDFLVGPGHNKDLRGSRRLAQLHFPLEPLERCIDLFGSNGPLVILPKRLL